MNSRKTNVVNTGFNLEKIYNEIEDISFNTENMSNKKIKKSDIIFFSLPPPPPPPPPPFFFDGCNT